MLSNSVDVAGGREAVRLPGETPETKRGFNRRGQRLAVEPHRDEFDGQRGALLKDCVETAKTEIKIRTVLHKGAGFGDGLLAEVGHFAEELGRPRLRRIWIDRQWRCDFREATRIEVRFSLRVELRDAIERAIQSKIFGPNGITEGKVVETFRLEGNIPRDERPGELRFHERFAHEIFRRDREIELRRSGGGGWRRNGNLERVRPILLHLKTAVAGQAIAFFTRRGDAISSERFRRELDLLREGTEIGKRYLFVENLPVFRVRHRDLERLARREARLLVIQIAGETLQMNDIARLINSAFREEKN